MVRRKVIAAVAADAAAAATCCGAAAAAAAVDCCGECDYRQHGVGGRAIFPHKFVGGYCTDTTGSIFLILCFTFASFACNLVEFTKQLQVR